MERILALLLVLCGCGSSNEGVDASISDAGTSDARRVDASFEDGGADGRGNDGGARDAGAATTCSDGEQNGLETMTDCGGPDCDPCDSMPPPVSEDAVYVDPAMGDDDSDGSQARPWRTLAHAFAQLGPGDELVLRGGRYREHDLSLDVDGSASSPVMIRGMPGEQAIIDGSLEEYARDDNGAWELVDASIGLYRSRASVEDEAYVARFFEGGVPYNLVPYRDGEGDAMANLSATNEAVSTSARYVGPGFVWEDGRLFVRLTPLSPDTLNGTAYDIPSESDPNRIALHFGHEDPIIALTGSHIQLRDFAIDFGRFGIRVSGGAADLHFEALTFEAPAIGVFLSEGTSDVVCSRLRVQGGFSPWVAWTDMKGSDGQLRPASHWSVRSVAVTGGPVSNVEIRESVFQRVWDGHVMSGSNISIHHNRYDPVYDDTLQLGTNSDNIELAHNLILGAGPSHYGNGDSPEPGTIYIHDNIIDNSDVSMLWGKRDPDGLLRRSYTGWQTHVSFPSHTSSLLGDGDPWKIYYNTVIFDGAGHTGGTGADQWTDDNATGVAHEVYNNVFVDVGGGPLLGDCTLGGATSTNFQIYDGNLYFRSVESSEPLFVDFAGDDYDSLADFLGSSGFEDSRVMIPTGWESRGVQADPRLSELYAPAADGPAGSGAIPLPEGFPGARHDYRGAVAP